MGKFNMYYLSNTDKLLTIFLESSTTDDNIWKVW